MKIKLLLIIVFVHTVTSKPQFGGLGGSLGNAFQGAASAAGALPGNVVQGGSSLLSSGLGINLDFGDFSSLFNKSYIDEAEKIFRQQIYLANRQLVKAHNILFEKGIVKYSLAINHFADWTIAEYLSILGVDLTKIFNAGKDFITSSVLSRKTRASDKCKSPDTKDWRKEGAVTPVKDQMKCASCWAFSAVGALEGQFFLKNGVLNSFSEQQFVDCSKDLGNNGCSKGVMENAFKYTQNSGIVTDKEYPYKAKDETCSASPNSMKIKGIEYIPNGSEEMLKDAVCRIGPVAAAMDASDARFMLYHDGIYYNNECSAQKTSHAVLVIGYDYDESTELDYWLIKNSYGAEWGKEGYIKVARNEKNHCGIASAASYPIL